MPDKGEEGHLAHIHSKAEEILDVRAEVTRNQGRAAAFVQRIGRTLGRPAVFLLLVAVSILWAVANLRTAAPWDPWDPYPFTFLATITSALGPLLTMLVLMYQRRNSRVAELRQEFNLQISLHLERQLSLTIALVRELHQHEGLPSEQDAELLDDLQGELDAVRLLRNVSRHLDTAKR